MTSVRLKKLERLANSLLDLAEEEEATLDALPMNLRYGEKAASIEQSAGLVHQAVEILEEALQQWET